MVKASNLVFSKSLYEAEAGYSVSSQRQLVRGCEPAVILRSPVGPAALCAHRDPAWLCAS